MSIYSNIYEKVSLLIDNRDFIIPNKQPNDSYFPTYLENLLNEYIKFYQNNLSTFIDDVVPFSDENGVKKKNVTINKIKFLSETIIRTVNLHYEGKTYQASKYFIENLNNESINDLIFSSKVSINTDFYRARKDDGNQFKASDLFHINYDLRHIVSTKRYSIPGLPALYFGNTTYVCWEEFDKSQFRDLWFVKMQNQQELNVTVIQRIEDFLLDLEKLHDDFKLTYLLSYLVTFPLTLATTIKVKNSKGNFKPEYIIPQMLLEYISNNETIDGIKFPSTKVNYNSLHNLQAYNYVFPVRKIKESGFCDELTNIFFTTHPTSLNFEEILDNPHRKASVAGFGIPKDDKEIELIEEVRVEYNKTAFGKLENKLQKRNLYKIK
ncbi:hypothetical protein CLU83_0278 [Flavobacterium sp. 1]|uniref:hypothetical protein n=1 Tax=Flavobacterium sp. 1 TaxID=2035200 RepID=UPI000C230B63|nr:hypothetical protein [Flavobacterium sp. 1]PJJ07131.1 hypothetical protein CLU83_0278 [Flavobacterium sp. 1]